MEHRRIRLVWVLMSSLVSLFVGAGVALTFATGILTYAQDTAALANATMAVTALEHLSSNNIQAATATRRLQLRASLDQLAVRESDLAQNQKTLVSKIQTRAAPLLRESE